MLLIRDAKLSLYEYTAGRIRFSYASSMTSKVTASCGAFWQERQENSNNSSNALGYLANALYCYTKKKKLFLILRKTRFLTFLSV